MWKYLRFSLFNMMLTVGFQDVAFVMLRHVSCIPGFSRTFIMKSCWISSGSFSASKERSCGYYPLVSVFIDLCILIHPWVFGISQTWPLWIIFFMCTWLQLASILLRIFASISSKIQAYNFLGSCLILI